MITRKEILIQKVFFKYSKNVAVNLLYSTYCIIFVKFFSNKPSFYVAVKSALKVFFYFSFFNKLKITHNIRRKVCRNY